MRTSIQDSSAEPARGTRVQSSGAEPERGCSSTAKTSFSELHARSAQENIDYFAFTAHKMYAPFGAGAVVGPTEELSEHMPHVYGGGTVTLVTDDRVVYKDPPANYEGGSPNYLGAVGLGKAIDVLQAVGFDNIEAHEQALIRKMIDGLKTLDNVILYGDTENISDRVGVVTFNFSDVNTLVLAKRLAASYGIATRRGAFCAHPYVWRRMQIPKDTLDGFAECTDVNTAGMIRASFGIYNTEEEVDSMLSIMPKALEETKKDMQNYTRAEPAY